MRSHLLCSLGLSGLVAAAACSQTTRNFGGAGGGAGGGGAAGTGGDTSTGTGADGGGGLGTGGGGSSQGGNHTGVGPGPQLVKSVPADGAIQASIEPYFLLYFDRPVSYAAATGKLRVSSGLVPEESFVQVSPCPDNDPTCIAGLYPEEFRTEQGSLQGDTAHTVVIDKGFPDPDGNTNDVDTTVSYTTFPYDRGFGDDSTAITSEIGGIDYDAVTTSLILCGVGPENDAGPVIRSIPIRHGVPELGTTLANPIVPGGGNYCYGLDVREGRIFASATYANTVFAFDSQLSGGPLELLHQTTLTPPNDELAEVAGTAGIGGSIYFGSGSYHSGNGLSGVVEYAGNGWSLWFDLTEVGDPFEGFSLAAGADSSSEAFVYVGLESSGEILKIRRSNKAIVNRHTPGDALYDAQLRTDSQGRLYVGTNDGIHVFDTSGSAGFTELATRQGLDAGRFGLREDGDTVYAYFIRFRGEAQIGMTSFEF